MGRLEMRLSVWTQRLKHNYRINGEVWIVSLWKFMPHLRGRVVRLGIALILLCCNCGCHMFKPHCKDTLPTFLLQIIVIVIYAFCLIRYITDPVKPGLFYKHICNYLIKSLTNSLFGNIFKTLSFPNHKSYGAYFKK